MWKWTDADNIKCIILDADSLKNEFLAYSYEQYIPNVKVYKVAFNEGALLGFDSRKEFFYYFDIITVIQFVLKEMKCSSYSLIAISDNNQFLKDMMQNHIGTIFAGEMKTDALKYTPDFTYKTIQKLEEILLENNAGYAAEVIASGSYLRRLLLKCDTNVNDDFDNYKLSLIFVGRYYAKSHNYLLDDPLTKVVQTFKNKYVEAVDKYYIGTINFLIRQGEKIDILCYVPLKPHEINKKRFNRFESLKLAQISNKDIHLQNILSCNKDYSQKVNASSVRKEVVRDVFAVDKNIDVVGKHIVVLDDVYTTGSTIEEIARVLYRRGASKVTAILLSVNQLLESYSCDYKHINCPNCNGKMISK